MKYFTLKKALIATFFGISTFSAFAVSPQVDSVASVIAITRTTAYSGSFVTGATDSGTSIKKIDLKPNTLSVISTSNTLKVENAGNISKFEIVSMNGSVLQSSVSSKSEINLNISRLQRGVYFARAYTANGIQTCKFVK